MFARIELAMVLFAKISFPGTLLLLIAAILIATGTSDAQTAPQQQNDQAAFRASQVQIVPPAANYHFPNGKTLVFTAEWHVFTAGTATIKLEPEGAFEKLTMAANSSRPVHLLLPGRDVFETQIHPPPYFTTRTFKHSERRKRQR